MSSRIYVGDYAEVDSSWRTPWQWRVTCPDCDMCVALLVAEREFPLDTTPYARAVITTFLELKFPDEHNCENFK